MESYLFKMKGYKRILFYLTESYLAEYLSFVITPYSLVLYLHIVMMVLKKIIYGFKAIRGKS